MSLIMFCPYCILINKTPIHGKKITSPVTMANWQRPVIKSVTAISNADILELQAVSTVALGPVNLNWFIRWPVIMGAVVPVKRKGDNHTLVTII